MAPFDPGPPSDWAALFAQAPLAQYEAHPSGRFRTAFGPVYYRGRLDGTVRLLIVGQDPSTDEILAQRILVGKAGQYVQGLLKKLGFAQRYAMFNTFLFGITGQFDATMRAASAADPIHAYRNALLDHAVATSAIEAVLAFGAAAQHAVGLWPGRAALPVFALVHPTALVGVTDQWNSVLPQLLAALPPEPGVAPDPRPYGQVFTPDDAAPVPRLDLPFGLPAWHGTGGTHSTRMGSPTKIVWTVAGS